MTQLNLINVILILSIAVLACSFGATPVTALATDNHHFQDVVVRAHGNFAKKKRASSVKRCKQRPSSSTTSSSTPKPSPNQPSKPSYPKSSSTTHSSSSKSSSATHSSSSKPSSTPNSSPPSSGNGKVGLAWPNGPSTDIKPFLSSKVKYIYTWNYNLYPNAASLGLTSCPMLWGPNMASGFGKTVVKGYAHCAFGFNEPNEPGQSNMSPSYGAQLWKQYLEPLRYQGYDMLVGPAMSSNPNGLTWVKNWYSACNGGCNPNVMGVHYYDVTASGFISYLNLWHDTFKLPIMVTEFACQNYNNGPQCSSSQVQTFMSDAINFMESTSWVVAYFAFGIMKNMQGVNTLDQLMNSAGQPTSLGYQYVHGLL